MGLIIYLDESGDMGWNFSAPFRDGGSSRYLTIASVCLPAEKKHLPKRLIRKLYSKFGWNIAVEKKWAGMNDNERSAFASAVHLLCETHSDIFLHSITVRKANVQGHIRTDGNKLYNYMIKLSLLARMKQYLDVHMIPDPRTIKVESGNSLPDYLQICLWFDADSKTKLAFQPLESHTCVNLQFADMLSGAIQAAFEDGNFRYFKTLAPHLNHKRLYFG